MRSALLATAIIGLVAAFPSPQDIDFDLAYALPNPTFTEAVGVTAQTVAYNPSTVYAAAAAQVTQSVTDSTAAVAATDATPVEKRAAACASQPVGYGPAPSPDTVSAFLALPAYSQAALAASAPSGYVQQFSNLQASNNAYGYLGYTTLKSYDVNLCAAKCNAINGCISINILYERSPSLEPGSGDSGCANPASTTLIKCVFWGGPVSTGNAVNRGQWRNKFQVVIAGSNGYTNASVASVPGYSPATPLGNAAINAPYDKFGYSSYLGVAMFIGSFDAALCAKACSEKSAYAIAHPPTDGTPVQTCQFFNTYILYINTTNNVQGQYCAMYAQSWGSQYATNVGQYRGNDNFKIQYSFSYSNITNPGTPNPLAAVYQARNDIQWPGNSAQPYCSSILGYTTPVVTTTIVATSTPLTTTTTTIIQTDLTTTTIIKPTTTTTTVTSTIVGAAKRDVGAIPTEWTTIDGIRAKVLPSVFGPSATEAVKRREIVLPQVLSKYPASIISSGCVLAATPVTITSTATSLVTSTLATVFSTEIQYTTTTATASATSEPIFTETAVATCTASYKFRIAGGRHDGEYVVGNEPLNNDEVNYGVLYPITLLEAAPAYTIRADGRISALSRPYGWTVYNGAWLSNILTMTDFSAAIYGWNFLRCSIDTSREVGSGAVGVLSCRQSNGAPSTFVTCTSLDYGVFASADISVAESSSYGCTGVTLQAIPVCA